MAPRQGGLAALMADSPDAFAYAENGHVEMWPSAPSPNAYRLATSPAAALEALAQGDYPLLLPEDADVPDLRTVMELADRQWAAPDGEPMFRSGPTGGGEPNPAHPLWRQLGGGE